MGYKVYYKNDSRGNTRFQQADGKVYKTKEKAQEKIDIYKKENAKFAREQGFKEVYEVRSTGSNSKKNSTSKDGSFGTMFSQGKGDDFFFGSKKKRGFSGDWKF